ncbi:MAG TPA: hypothetical protein VM490_08155 [Armatimonadaceae bacterium]|nr:hypothetical protein [Armatimonadaceae bacterium]
MNINIGGLKIRLKPAAVVLILAVVFGVAATVILAREPGQRAPEYGYANPQGWRFETRNGAEADVVALGSPAAKATPTSSPAAGGAISTLDAEKGFKIAITKSGTRPDSVYLRNALNLDLNPSRKPLRLTFEARSGADGDAGSPPFPLTVTVREGKTSGNDVPLWSQKISVDPKWTTHAVRIDVKQSSLLNVIMAIHLGEKPGTVQIKNLRVIDDAKG